MMCVRPDLYISHVHFPSRVSGRGYKIGPMCVCVCRSVCLSVSQRSPGWTVWATDLKFGVRIDLDNISDEFEGQSHRSKVKVAILKKTWFSDFSYGVTYVDCTEPFRHDTWRHVTSCHDIMTSRDVLTSFGDFSARILTRRARCGRGRQRSGVFILRMFSYIFTFTSPNQME